MVSHGDSKANRAGQISLVHRHIRKGRFVNGWKYCTWREGTSQLWWPSGDISPLQFRMRSKNGLHRLTPKGLE
jgi:hypothetical protein